MATAVGVVSVISLSYCIILDSIHFALKHPAASKVLLNLSRITMLSITLCPLFITLSYYAPTIKNHCLCKYYFNATVIAYIISVYIVKYMYIHRVMLLSTNPILSNGSGKLSSSIKILIISACIALIACIVMAILLIEGSCDDDIKFGCSVSFNPVQGYVFLICYSFDTILYVWFADNF